MYYINRFGDYNFLQSTGNPTDSVASGGSFPSVTRTPDSWYNFRHATPAPRDISQIPIRKVVYAPNCVTAPADVYRDLRAKRGQLDRLFRTWKDTPFRQEWIWARLESFDGVEQIRAGSSPLFTVADMVFTAVGPYWYGQGWGGTDYTVVPFYQGSELTVSQAGADVTFAFGGAGSGVEQVLNRGNRNVLGVEVDLINLAVGASNYTVEVQNVTSALTAHGWRYDGTSATGNPIGGGAFVTVNGVNRTVRKYTSPTTYVNTYNELTRLGANEQFLVLYPGVNDIYIEVAVTSGSVNLLVMLNYFDAWE